ncbi:MAG TPA: hypothetical protein VM686_27245 [Polyangiaceae bacterium]|nr:hypothetical protein [Polyangiaceae bacterium]
MNGWSAWLVIPCAALVLSCSSDGGGSDADAGAGGTSAGGNGRGGTMSSAGTSSAGTSSGGAPGEAPQIGGCAVFPADDAWNQDISGADADPDWTSRLQAMVGDVNLHPDYGNDGDVLYGIPINTVPENQPALDIAFDWYEDESDPGPYPFPDPSMVKIEGGDAAVCDGDCHVLVVQQGSCMLYEGYACHYEAGWHCGNGAVWDLNQVGYGQRPEGWTSADAAGLAITPGVLRYDEVAAGEVHHAIRFTTECSRPNYVEPATHYAVPGGCDESDPNSPPMGLRVRLRADFDVSGFSAGAQAVLRAMQTYGMILADNGSNFYFQGEAHPDWNSDEIEELKQVPASEFEVITPPPLMP